MIDKELLNILCCPETKQELVLADDALLAKINAKVEKGTLKNRAGQDVGEKIEAGLVRDDKAFLYPVRDNIPVMLIDEAIPLKDL